MTRPRPSTPISRCGTRKTPPAAPSTSSERGWPTCRYVDPLLEAEGRDAPSDMVAAVHAQYPGHRFRRISGIDAHHDQVRFAWLLAGPDGGVTVAGVDVGTVALDGRLVSITGFFGDPPDLDG